MTPQVYQHILAQIDQATNDCKMDSDEARVFLADLTEDVEARLVPLVLQGLVEDPRSDDGGVSHAA